VTWNRSDICSDQHILLYDVTLSSEKIDEFIAHLFDRGVPTARPSSVLMPYSSNNPPPLVRVLNFFKSFSDLWSYELILIIHQDLYPARPVDTELFDSNHDGQDDPMGDDDGGQGAPSADPIVPNMIGSGMAAQVLPSAADQSIIAATLGSGHSKKKRLVLVSKHKQPASSDQVTTELFPYHAPRRSLGLVAVRLVFLAPIWSFSMPHSGCQDRHFSWGWHSASQKTSGNVDEENACGQVCDSLDLCFTIYEFILYSHDSSVNRKPSSVDPSKKLLSPHLFHMLPQSLLLREWLVTPRCLLLRLRTIIDGQLNSWRA
jgi:hypothetical protein